MNKITSLELVLVHAYGGGSHAFLGRRRRRSVLSERKRNVREEALLVRQFGRLGLPRLEGSLERGAGRLDGRAIIVRLGGYSVVF